MVATYSVTDAAVTDAVARALGMGNKLLVENEVLASSDYTTYAAAEQNWLTSPYPVISVNGTVVSGAVISFVSGTVTFASAKLITDNIAATFWFQPYTTEDMQEMCLTALSVVEARLATSFDETAFPRAIFEPVINIAHIIAMRGLQAMTAEYYAWSIEGRKVDKHSVTRNYDIVIMRQERIVSETLAWLRPQYLAEGRTAYMNIDRGRRPSIYSQYVPALE